MNASTSNAHNSAALASQARELFAARVATHIHALEAILTEHLSKLLDETRDPREMQKRRDAWIAFPKISATWTKQVLDAWHAQTQGTTGNTLSSNLGSLDGLSLIEDDSVENKILASRIALRLLDKVSWELNDLTVRMKALEGIEELSKKDVLRPESLATALVEAWQTVGMERDVWPLLQDKVLELLCEQLPAAYKEVNALLIKHNVMREIDLRNMVKRTPSGGNSVLPGDSMLPSDSMPMDSAPSAVHSHPGAMGQIPHAPNQHPSPSGYSGHFPAGQAGAGGAGAAQNWRSQSTVIEPSPPPMMPGAPAPRHFGFSLQAIRHHAENVVGGLKRVLTQRVGMPSFERAAEPNVQLMQDLAPADTGHMPQAQQALVEAVPYALPPAGGYTAVHIQRAQEALRQHSNELKKMTDEKAEKAIIELVALIFQNIINEDRIAPSIRIWIARLQMPVLRLALEEPEFFETLDHPARKLLDHLGSCVLGFTGDTPNAELEQEVKRIVQVIEQYPETGKRVFELVYGEFKKFLEKHLVHQSDAATRMVSLASQVEEKESLVIKYTIEMRDQLAKLALRDEVRDFLFHTWAQVLAVATMKFGAQAPQTMAYKQFTPDLIWAAGAKPSRAERQKAIADVPGIMATLRLGMKLISCPEAEQTAIIESINTVLTDAFMSKTEPINQEVLAVLSERLANLEDYVTDADLGRELPLDAESIEMVLGIDTSGLNLITGEGSPETSEDIAAWMQSLLLGSWHRLDHNGHIDRVQFCWRSAQGQLYLFVSGDGNAYLFQRRGLAAYLSAALLLPAEEEALTVIATREALSKIEANPARMTA